MVKLQAYIVDDTSSPVYCREVTDFLYGFLIVLMHESHLCIYLRVYTWLWSVYTSMLYTPFWACFHFPQIIISERFLYKRMKQFSRIESVTLIDNCDIVWPLWHCLSIYQILIRTHFLVLKYVLLMKCKIYINVEPDWYKTYF